MEPVEINAGAYYLRQLRADDRVDDRLALMDAFADVGLRRWVTRWRISSFDEATEYVAARAEEWASGERCSWAVAEPVSGALLGEVDLIRLSRDWRVAEAGCWVAPEWRGRGVAVAALGAALRFVGGALGVRQVDYLHAPDNQASYRVAQKCGFTHKGTRDGLILHTLNLAD